MDQRLLVPLFRRWWPTILAVTVVAAAIGAFTASQRPTTYESRARLLVGPVNGELDELRAGDLLARTYAELVTSTRVLDDVVDEVYGTSEASRIDAVRRSIRATADGSTRTVVIRVEADDPVESGEVANGLAQALEDLSSEGGVAPDGGRVTILDAASIGVAESRQTLQLGVLSGLAAAVLSVLLLAAFGNVRSRVHDDDEVTVALGVEPLGTLSAHRSLRGRSQLDVVWAPSSERSMDYRLVSRKLELVSQVREFRSFLVMGVDDGTSAAELAANVAYAMSERGTEVALIDADPRGRLTTLVERSRNRTERPVAPGSGIVAGRWMLLAEHLILFGHGGQGPHRMSPASLLQDALEAARTTIVYAPPQEEAPEALEWAGAVDATIVVVDRGRTRVREIRNAARSLHLVDAVVLGSVIDGAGREAPSAATDDGEDTLTAPPTSGLFSSARPDTTTFSSRS